MGAGRDVALGNTIFWFSLRTANRMTVETGKTIRRVASIDHILLAPRSVATPASQRFTAPPFGASPGQTKPNRASRTKARGKSPCVRGKNSTLSSQTFFLSVLVSLSISSPRCFGNMWCCKRLDASDWPVTTVVRGNISCLYVAAAVASLTFETPGCCSRDYLSFSFLFLSFPHGCFFSFLHRFFAASRKRERD